MVSLVGEMDTELTGARIALRSMIEAAASTKPGPGITNNGLIRRTLAGRAAIRTVEKAMEVVGGGSFYRRLGLERLFRDIQGRASTRFRTSGSYATRGVSPSGSTSTASRTRRLGDHPASCAKSGVGLGSSCVIRSGMVRFRSAICVPLLAAFVRLVSGQFNRAMALRHLVRRTYVEYAVEV